MAYGLLWLSSLGVWGLGFRARGSVFSVLSFQSIEDPGPQASIPGQWCARQCLPAGSAPGTAGRRISGGTERRDPSRGPFGVMEVHRDYMVRFL